MTLTAQPVLQTVATKLPKGDLSNDFFERIIKSTDTGWDFSNTERGVSEKLVVKNKDFSDSDFSGCRRSKDTSCLDNISFQNCTFNRCSFRRANLNAFGFKDCVFDDADFYGADFINASFEQCDLTKARGIPKHPKAELTLKRLATEFISRERLLWMPNWVTPVRCLLDFYEAQELSYAEKERIREILETNNSCNTTYCIAGGAVDALRSERNNRGYKTVVEFNVTENTKVTENVNVTLGQRLKDHFGYEIAGLFILGAEAHLHFWDRDQEALEWLREVATR
jgi:hypothetical protein